MYKSRLGIWLGGIGVIILLFLGGKLIGWLTEESPVYNVYIQTTDNVLKSNVSDVDKKYTYNLYNSKEGADIIIQPSSDETIEGYTKYSNYVYTPMVLWARTKCTETNYGFNVLNASSNYGSTVYKDLLVLIEAMEEGKTFKEIGIDNRVAEGNVTIYIPARTSIYYPLIVDLFYVTLNDGKVPTDIQRKNLEDRVNAIIAKCNTVEDMGQTMYNLYKKNDKSYTVFLGPECILARDTYAFNTSNDGAWMTVYLNQTVVESYDVFVATDRADALIASLAESDFVNETGYRLYNNNKLSSSFSHTIDNVTIAQ